MTSGVKRTENGWEITRKALNAVGALLLILSTVVGTIAGTISWKTSTSQVIASKVDERRFIADSIRLDLHEEQENLHYQELRDLVTKTEARVSDIWCESHFKGAPPRSCQ